MESQSIGHEAREVKIRGKVFEGCKQYEKASELYKNFIVKMEDHDYLFPTHYLGSWPIFFNERLVIVYEKLKRYKEAISICRKVLRDPKITDDVELLFYTTTERLHREANLRFTSKSIMPKFRVVSIERATIKKGKRRLFLGKGDNELSVEQVALEYYQSEKGGSWNGFWTESIQFFLQGTMDRTFWGTFLDFLTPDEASNNTRGDLCKLITTRINERYKDDLESIRTKLDTLTDITPAWTSLGREQVISGYNWYFHAILEYAPAVIRTLTKDQIGSIVSRAINFTSRRGIPDLFLFKNSKSYMKHKFVEVKSQRDKLSCHQLTWFKFLQENGMNIELCRVTQQVKSSPNTLIIG